ncbi:hypothetical protein Q8G28_17620 [Lysinibacillus capsici]|uniref:hypothetical protein n=1 Tax=Lysinibacillus capsici TaxID=2115968 RepID=UPI00272FA2C0|nr:hypothetical protein [Lysinibacillus capsici]MDP1395292.1 hypothetical protein [Lysinibacillus capsici]MDP1415757.1 hypothetical protein [Lysinibacillus capsici]MDP1431563.1 hypothetical protein [Lysinibacillus capsici]
MKKFAQIINSKIHWIFEADGKPEFAPDIVIIDITDKPEVQEGWGYNNETGEFTAPVIPEPTPIETPPTVEEMQAQTLLNTEYLVSRSELLGGM